MKVLIVGSIAEKLPQEQKSLIQTACKEIGDSLARSKITLIVGSDNPKTADWWVIEGAAESGKAVSVDVYRPFPSGNPISAGQSVVPFSKVEETDKYKKVKFRHPPTHGFWDSAHVAAIQASDAVLVISGAEGARSAGYVAVVLGKPMLPIGSLPGSSSVLWNNYRAGYQQIFGDEEVRYLFTEWTPSSSGHVLPAIERIKRRNPYGERIYSVSFIMMLTLITLLAWLSVFAVTQIYLDRSLFIGVISIVILSIVATIFGVCLRGALAYLSSEMSPKPRSIFLAEMVTGIILTFGFILFFFLSSVIVSPQGPVLTNPSDFQRVAICASLLGFGASFLLERAVHELTQRFRHVIESPERLER